MNKMNAIVWILMVVSGVFFTALPERGAWNGCCGVRSASAEEDWKKEFEAICSRTDDAMSFSKDELKGLIARCDKVKSVIETLDESTRKVYLKRLKLCRDLFAFVLDAKEKN